MSSFCTVERYDSGGKTYALLGLFILLSKIYAGSRWAIVRADLPTIKKNTYPSWDKIKPINFIKKHDRELHTVTFTNGSQLIFFPESYDTDKELNRWKGLEVNGFGFEEINECKQQTLQKAFERAGSYIIKGIKRQPPPLVVATANPSFGWVKDVIYNPWKNKTINSKWLYIQSRIHDNIPLLEEQPLYLPSLKNNLSKYEYEVYVNGNWDVQLKTGGEFLKEFELSKNLCQYEYNETLPLHISIDNNSLPYIAISIWQTDIIENKRYIYQVHEIPAKDPNNTAYRAGFKLLQYLTEIGYTNRIFLYGDPTVKARNTIDEEKRSFYDIFKEPLLKAHFNIQDCFFSKAPPVAATGDYINTALEKNWFYLKINEGCKESINDYICTKQDENGNLLKTRVKDSNGASYEEHGHFLDTMRYFVIKLMKKEFDKFQTRYTDYSQLPQQAPHKFLQGI